MHNLRRNPNIALVIGGTSLGDERTVQYEGITDEPNGPKLRLLKELYFASFRSSGSGIHDGRLWRSLGR